MNTSNHELSEAIDRLYEVRGKFRLLKDEE
jgi:hypothetical protein